MGGTDAVREAETRGGEVRGWGEVWRGALGGGGFGGLDSKYRKPYVQSR